MLTSLLTTLLATTALAWPTTLSPRQEIQKCYSGVYIIVARGTFEPEGVGLQVTISNAIMDRIPDSNVTAVVYPAGTDVATGVPIGANSTQQLATAYYNACPDSKMVLLGYSQGAVVIGQALGGGPNYVPVFGNTGNGSALSQEVGKNIVAVVLFGDLNRNLGLGKDGETTDVCTKSSTYPRNGTRLEAMQFYGDRLEEWCAATDGACCDGEINLFAHLGYTTAANGNATADFVASKFYGTS